MLICMNASRLTLYMMITFYPFEDACFNAWNSLIEYEFLIWIKMHIWIHKIWFFVLFEKNNKMHLCMHENLIECEFFYLNENACLNAWNWIFCFFWRVRLWMNGTLWIFWMKMHAWMHEFFLSFWFFLFFLFFYFFLRMHLWMHEICLYIYFYFEWKCMFRCMKLCLNLIFFLFCSFWKMHILMHKIWFFMFCYFWRMHAWMHEIRIFFFWRMHVKMHEISFFINFYYLEWKCMFEYMKFSFWFSWMIMHILKHEILFFIFILLNDNAWNSIFIFFF